MTTVTETAPLVAIEGEVRSKRRFDSGYTVLSIISSANSNATLVGTMPDFAEGMSVRAKCNIVTHPKYGKQYQVVEIEEVGFSNEDALVIYLASPAFPNIGMATARKIVGALGLETIDALDNNSSRLFGIEGVPDNKAQILIEHWQKEREQHRLMAQLMGLGLTASMATKVHKHFGDAVTQIVTREPYRLTEVHGIGFHKADDIAIRNGIDRKSEERVCSAVKFTLESALNKGGNCFESMQYVCDATVDLLKRDVASTNIISAVRLMETRGAVAIEGSHVYLSHIYHAEKYVAEKLLHMIDYASDPLYVGLEALQADIAQIGLDFDLAPEQEAAILEALNSRVVVITGGPGTGKTTITRVICDLLDNHNITMRLCSPTGRAAKRLSEATGADACTIHRLLGVDRNKGGGFKYNENNPLPTNCVLVDEMSMVDISLFRSLISAMETNSRLIMVGDADQLPSVGPGQVLRDLIKSGVIPTVKLERIFRQAKGSAIIEAAYDVLHGKVPLLPTPKESRGRNFMFAGSQDIDKVMDIILQLVYKNLPEAGFKAEDIQVLTPMREKGLGINDINPKLQDIINPSTPDSLEVEAGILNGQKRIFRVGDRVMHIHNDYEKEVFNGDVGCVTGVNRSGETPTIAVTYPDNPAPITYEQSEFDDLLHSWACTIHKSQGGQFKAVIVVAHSSQRHMMQRNLIYTAITRAEKICIVVGTEAAVQAAVENAREQQRNTSLVERLQEG